MMHATHRFSAAAFMSLMVSCGFGQTSQPSTTEFDACGTLVISGGCLVFRGGGGDYYLGDYGRYAAGDSVRVIGTLNPDCVTICSGLDGCIQGAITYDPAVYPCGSTIPSLADDLIPALTDAACTAASGVLGGAGIFGMMLARPRHRHPDRRINS